MRLASSKDKRDLSNFEYNINSARELLAEMSGFDYYSVGQDISEDHLSEQIEKNTITEDIQNKCLANFLNEMHISLPVRDCACCGEKECAKMLDDELVGVIDLNTKEGRDLCYPLLMIKTPSEATAKNAANYREIYETFLVAVEQATIEEGKEETEQREEKEDKEEIVRKQKYLGVFNHYNLEVSGNTSVYALHPELVTTENKCRVCSTCLAKLKKREIPNYAIRNGYDYGNCKRIGLPDLSDVAKVVLGQCSAFGASIIKIKQTKKEIDALNVYDCITGHFIVFSSTVVKNPQVTPTEINNAEEFKRRTANSISVSFVGSLPNWNFLKHQIRKYRILSSVFSLDVKMLKPWVDYLNFREAVLGKIDVNVLGRSNSQLDIIEHLNILGDATNIFNDQNQMDDLLDQILENCQVCSDKSIDLIDKAVTADTSKTAEKLSNVREMEEDIMEKYVEAAVDEEFNEMPPIEEANEEEALVKEEIKGDKEPEAKEMIGKETTSETTSVPSKEVYKAIPIMEDINKLTAGVLISNLEDLSKPMTKLVAAAQTILSNEKPAVIYKRKNDPFNEFQHNAELLLGLFFTYLRWELVFISREHYTTNTYGTSCANSMDDLGKTKCFRPETVIKVSEWLNDDVFQDRLRYAADNPESSEAKALIKEILPLIRISSGAVPRYGPDRQKFVTTNLINYLRFFGYPTMFVTLSPSDAENVLGLKMIINTNTVNEKKTATFDEKVDTTVEVNLDYAKRNEYIQSSPHFYALAFQKMVDSFFRCLVGLDIETNMKRTLPLEEREMGIFGKIAGHYSVIETQARGTLHIHTLIFGGSLNAKVLDRAAISERLRGDAARLIDSMVQAQVSAETARQDLIRRLYSQSPDRPNLKAFTEPEQIRNYLNHIGEPHSNFIHELRIITQLSLCATNNHSHSASCHVGKIGKSHCRYGFPQSLVSITRPVWLYSEYDESMERATNEQKEEIQKSLEDKSTRKETIKIINNSKKKPVAKTNLTTGQIIYPASSTDTVYWEVARPPFTEADIDEDFNDALDAICTTQNEIDAVKEKFYTYNSNVVEYNPCIATALHCNQSIQLLGSTEQAKAATFYCTEYMAKRESELGKTLSILWQALQDIKMYPSKAEDEDLAARTVKHLFQRNLNKIIGQDEISAPMAALIALGYASSLGSHKGRFLDTWSAITKILQDRETLSGKKDDEILEEKVIAAVEMKEDVEMEVVEEEAEEEVQKETNVVIQNLYDLNLNSEDEDLEEESIQKTYSEDSKIRLSAIEMDKILDDRLDYRNCDAVDEACLLEEINNPDGEKDLEETEEWKGMKYGLEEVEEEEDEGDVEIENLSKKSTYKSLCYKTFQGETIWIESWEHYFYRGENLKGLSIFEYNALIEVVKKKTKMRSTNVNTFFDVEAEEVFKEEEEEEEDETKMDVVEEIEERIVQEEKEATKRGRKQNSTFEFSPFHPLYKSHYQRLRSKILVPFLAGAKPPKLSTNTLAKMTSGNEKSQYTISEEKDIKRCAVYYSVLLIPWVLPKGSKSRVIGPEIEFTKEEFINWINSKDSADRVKTFLQSYAINTMTLFRTTQSLTHYVRLTEEKQLNDGKMREEREL
eukprot:gene8076-8732_t